MVKAREPRRKQGRPNKGAPAVGREVLVAATRELMKSIPPGQITRLWLATKGMPAVFLLLGIFGVIGALATVLLAEETRWKPLEELSP